MIACRFHSISTHFHSGAKDGRDLAYDTGNGRIGSNVGVLKNDEFFGIVEASIVTCFLLMLGKDQGDKTLWARNEKNTD